MKAICEKCKSEVGGLRYKYQIAVYYVFHCHHCNCQWHKILVGSHTVEQLREGLKGLIVKNEQDPRTRLTLVIEEVKCKIEVKEKPALLQQRRLAAEEKRFLDELCKEVWD